MSSNVIDCCKKTNLIFINPVRLQNGYLDRKDRRIDRDMTLYFYSLFAIDDYL